MPWYPIDATSTVRICRLSEFVRWSCVYLNYPPLSIMHCLNSENIRWAYYQAEAPEPLAKQPFPSSTIVQLIISVQSAASNGPRANLAACRT